MPVTVGYQTLRDVLLQVRENVLNLLHRQESPRENDPAVNEGGRRHSQNTLSEVEKIQYDVGAK